MPAVTVRNLSEETHRALKIRAVHNGRSTEAEIRLILDNAVSSKQNLRIGSALAALGRRFDGVDLETARQQTAAEPADFA